MTQARNKRTKLTATRLNTAAGGLLAMVGLALSLATNACAAPIQCPEGRGVYQAAAGPAHELIFAGDKGTLALAKGRAWVRYPFDISYSNGSVRTYVNVRGKDAPSSMLMAFNPDFTPYRGQGSAAYLVTPELSLTFSHWEPFRARPDYSDLLPADSWQLVRCSPGS